MNIANGVPFWYGIGKAAFMGAVSGAISFGIGSIATNAFQAAVTTGKAMFQAGMHGITGGMMSELQGGTFASGLASGAVSSLVSSGIEGIGETGGMACVNGKDVPIMTEFGKSSGFKALMLASGGLSGGLSSSIAGGNFYAGVRQGLITSGLNHLAHMTIDAIEKRKTLNQRFKRDANGNYIVDPQAAPNFSEEGMKVLIREGSAAKNFEALIYLLPENYENMMFCSDDKHPDDLIVGHINLLCARAVANGIDVFKILQAACVNPVHHYKMKVGLLQEDDAADFIVVEDLINFKVKQTYINGELVAENGKSFVQHVPFETPNNFNITFKEISDFEVSGSSSKIRVIEALEGQLITNEMHQKSLIVDGKIVSDTENDILKMAVVNRYENTKPAVAFIKNFGLKSGAIASSVAHDCHNIVVVGTSDAEICNAVNLIIKNKGGVCAVNGLENKMLPLPVAGIMSDKNGWETGKLYQKIDAMAKDLGSTLKAPFMILSFMALLVIPDLKLSDKELFSGNTFSFVDLEVKD